MLTNTQRRELIEKVRSFPAQLEAAVRDLTPVQLTTRSLAGEWTVAQIVHHLADSHINAFVRVKLMLTEDRPTLKPYNQEAWAETAEAESAAIGGALDILRGLHERWVALFESLGDADWGRKALHPESGELTVDDILVTYANHGEAHLAQINRTLAAGGE